MFTYNPETEDAISQRESFFNSVDSFSALGQRPSSPPYKFCQLSAMTTEAYRKNISRFFHLEPCPYDHRYIRLAAEVFEIMKHPIDNFRRRSKPYQDLREQLSSTVDEDAQGKAELLSKISFASDGEKRVTYCLAFQTLKYFLLDCADQKFLQEMIDDSDFLEKFPELADEFSQVMVILCDFQQRRFQLRLPGREEAVDPHLRRIETSLYKTKTKLSAALARSRIKARVLTLDSLLPQAVRQNDQIASHMTVCAWINLNKTRIRTVTNDLLTDGFSRVDSIDDLVGRTFMSDRQCFDVLFFPGYLLDCLEKHELVINSHIVLQDKSSITVVHSVRALIGDGDDILHINVGSGVNAVHLASLTINSATTIFGLGVQTERQQKLIAENVERMGANGRVTLFGGDFLEFSLDDERLRNVKIVLLTAACSKSGVVNPVNFLVHEGDDLYKLRELSLGSSIPDMVQQMSIQHMALLKHALLLPRVQGVVYNTRSLFDVENETVVTASVDFVTTCRPLRPPFRVGPPVLTFSEAEVESDNPVAGKFLKYQPSVLTSGCFVAVITREADDPQEAARGILARATARGIIAGVVGVTVSGAKKEGKKRRKKKGQKKDGEDSNKKKETIKDVKEREN